MANKMIGNMKLLSKSANKMRELVDFVNEKKIKKEDIIEMSEMKDGVCLLLYYGEE